MIQYKQTKIITIKGYNLHNIYVPITHPFLQLFNLVFNTFSTNQKNFTNKN